MPVNTKGGGGVGGVAEQLLLQRDVIRRPLHSAVLAWSQHAFVNAATVHGDSPPRTPSPFMWVMSSELSLKS